MTSILALQKLALGETDALAESTHSVCCAGSTQSNANCCNAGPPPTQEVQ